MALDASILDTNLIGAALQSDPVSSFFQGQEAAKDRRRKEESFQLKKQQEQVNLEAQKLQNLSNRERQTVTSEVLGAGQLKTYLDGNDLEGAKDFANQRRIVLQNRIANGEDLNTQSTDRALELIDSAIQGDKASLDRLKSSVNAMFDFGRNAGIIRTSSMFTPTAAQKNSRVMQEALARGDTVSASILGHQLGVLGTGQQFNKNGEVVNITGVTQALSDVEKAKTGAKLDVEIAKKPQLQERLEKVKTRAEADRPLPAPIQKANTEQRQDLQTSYNIVQDINGLIGQIDDGTLNIGLYSNAANKVKNGLSLSTEESVNFNRFEGFLEKLRNDALRLNTGVQTDGDAERALNEIISNKTDPNVVKARLQDLQTATQRGVEQRLGTFKNFLKENKRQMPTRDELFGTTGSVFSGGQETQQQQQQDTSVDDLLNKYAPQ